MALHELVEEAHAESRGPLGHQRRVLLGPGHARDIKMRPGHAIDEALQELRRGDAAGIAALADVLHVGRLAVDLAVVGLAERHAPERLLYGLARRGEPGGKLVVVAEHA